MGHVDLNELRKGVVVGHKMECVGRAILVVNLSADHRSLTTRAHSSPIFGIAQDQLRSVALFGDDGSVNPSIVNISNSRPVSLLCWVHHLLHKKPFLVLFLVRLAK